MDTTQIPLQLPHSIPEPIPLREPGFSWVTGFILAGLPVLLIVAMLYRQKWILILAQRTKVNEVETDIKDHEKGVSDVASVQKAADLARVWLAKKLGPKWIARTTESMLEDSQLNQALNLKTRESLFELLQESDRQKFQPPQNPLHHDRWTGEELCQLLNRLYTELFALPEGSSGSGSKP